MPKSERSFVQEELSAFRKSMGQMAKEMPELNQAFMEFMGACIVDAKLSCKTKELITLGAAVAAHCPPCILLHVGKLLEVGASREEILEAAYVGVLMGGGPAFAHMRYVFEALDDAGA